MRDNARDAYHINGSMTIPINQWHWHRLDSATRSRIIARAEADIADAGAGVAAIIAAVRARGDAALYDYARQFDGAEITGSLKVSDAEFEQAYRDVAPEVVAAIRFCAENVRIHHQQQMARVERQWLEAVRPGIYGGEKITAVESVGLYVPRGKGSFPSMMYMLCIPAKLAGVPHIAVCTPPTPEGGADAASLVAADICGVRDIYKVGGAQAIAALAYGTQTIPAVAMVSGPGSAYVAAAKRLLGAVINPGMPAGPTDSLILADATAHPENTAWDMINEAEHGSDSAVLLVTPSPELARAVAAVLPGLIAALPEPRRAYCMAVFANYGGIVITRDMAEALAVTNLYAAEHVLVKVAEPVAVVDAIRNAGEILIGESTPMVLGNFGIGVNAVLPTGRHARTHSATSVWSYLKRTSLAYVSPQGFETLRPPVIQLADYEGFSGHAGVLRHRDISVFSQLDVKAFNR